MRLVFGSILVVGGVIAVTVLTRLLAQGDQEKRLALGFSGLRLVAMVLVPVGALMILSSGVRMISAGQVGVALLFGKVQPVVLHEGINLVNPLYDVVEMNTRVLRHQAKYDAASKDLQAVHVEMVLNYRLLPDKAAEVYQRIGPNFASVIIDPAAQEVLKANTALHVATEILHQRPKIKADIQGELTTWLAKYGIEVKEAALANIKFDPAYEKAIEGKQIEEQKAEQKRYELVQAQRQAEIAAAQAKGQGDAARGEGQGRRRGHPDSGRRRGHLQPEGIGLAHPDPDPAAIPGKMGREAPAVFDG